MTSIVTQWHEYSDEEKRAWLMIHVLKEPGIVPDDHVQPAYDMVFINRCEQALNSVQRAQYIKYMNSDIAIKTYSGMSDEEQQTEATADKFYWNYLTAPHDLRGRCIWNVVADFAP